ncbi:MAG: S53 family peptidase [Terracidiphilus sp.]
MALLGLLTSLSVVPAVSQPQSNASMESPTTHLPARFRTASRLLITQGLNFTNTVLTRGAVHSDVAVSRDLGPVDGSMVMDHLQLVLRRPSERQSTFDAFVNALHQPGSDVYHQWLTPDEIGALFGPSPSDLEAIRNFLESEGFAVNHVGKSGMFIDFTGTASQVERSFHTQIHNVLTPDGRHRYSAIAPASIPEALAPIVVGFASMSDIGAESAFRPAPSQERQKDAQPGDTDGTCDNGPCYDVGPQDFYTIYNETPPTANGVNNGDGVTIALLEQSDINPADVTKFRTMFDVYPSTPPLTVIQGYTLHGSTSPLCSDPGFISGDETEATLDVEWAGAVAPGAALLVMSCAPAATEGILMSAEAVIDDNLAPILSLSYINAESTNATSTLASNAELANSLWEQAAAQGQTVVVCAGDSGSATDVPNMHMAIASNGIFVNAFASTPYDVAAGGTDFQDTYNQLQNDPSFTPSDLWAATNSPTGFSSALGYIPETAWNDSCAGSLLANSVNNDTPNEFCDVDPGGNYDFLNSAGSGGISILYARPSWQNGTVYGLPTATGTANFRLVPDISFFASDGNSHWDHALIFYQSDEDPPVRHGGGTSFVAPEVAGIFAIIEQKTRSRLGQPNYELYPLAGAEYGATTFTGAACNGSGSNTNNGITTSLPLPGNTCIFYDIETGNNSQECDAGTHNCYFDGTSKYGILSTSTTAAQPAYPAGPGYDLATGIGSANVTNLVAAWPSPTFILTALPANLKLAAGQSGAVTVTVVPSNGFSSPLSLGCSGLPPQASCTFNPPTLTPNGTAAPIKLTIATTASGNALLTPSELSRRPTYALLSPGLAALLGLIMRRNRRGWRSRLLCSLFLLFVGLTLSGCGTNYKFGTPGGTYTVIVSASSSSASSTTQSVPLQITITE